MGEARWKPSKRAESKRQKQRQESSGRREKTLGGDTRPRSGMRQSDVGSNPLLSETQCQLRLSPADTDLRSPGIIIVSSVKRMQARWNTKGMAASHPCSLAVVVVGSDIIIYDMRQCYDSKNNCEGEK